jgi:hypothetical protein
MITEEALLKLIKIVEQDREQLDILTNLVTRLIGDLTSHAVINLKGTKTHSTLAELLEFGLKNNLS